MPLGGRHPPGIENLAYVSNTNPPVSRMNIIRKSPNQYSECEIARTQALIAQSERNASQNRRKTLINNCGQVD